MRDWYLQCCTSMVMGMNIVCPTRVIRWDTVRVSIKEQGELWSATIGKQRVLNELKAL